MDSITLVLDMHAWLRWCTARSTQAARGLHAQELRRPFPMGLGSVMGTLVHLYGAERIWLAVLTGRTVPPFPTIEEFPTLDDLQAQWEPLHADWDVYLRTLTPTQLERVVVRVRDGREHRQRVLDALLQLPTHALYHNAQLSNMFRQMGHQLPDSGYILWARERFNARTEGAGASTSPAQA